MKTIIKLGALMLAALMLAGALCGCGKDSGVVRMATKPMTEQYIIGYMMKELIEQETGLTVELTEGVGGGTSNIQPAMLKGEFDLYPEYTGTGWNTVLKESDFYTEALFDALQAGYGEMGMVWTGMLGFNNTYGVAVTDEAAQKYDLHTITELAAVADQLRFGANYDFYEREDGFPLLEEKYGLSFKETADMDISLKYEAIKQRQIDCMPVFTTDGQLTVAGITVLEDDLGIYPSYMCGFVVQQKTLEKHPELQAVLDSVAGIFTDESMAALNYAVEAEGQAPETVAHDFLVQKGLLR